MKIKCDDGITRNFILPTSGLGMRDLDSVCDHCGEEFGVNDTYILKPKFKKHVCSENDIIKRNKATNR